MFKEEKSVVVSKTFWWNILIVLAAFIPGATEFVSDNAQPIAAGVALINMGLRKVSKKDIKIKRS